MLKDLINVFKKTYEEYNKDKIAARNSIKKLNDLLEGQGEIFKTFCKIMKMLDEVYFYCPELERKHIIEPMLDFLKYRYRIAEGLGDSGSYIECGYITSMEHLVRLIEFNLQEAKQLYDNYQYKECVEYVEKSISSIKNEFEKVKANFIEPKK